jgi:hypothetical protein
LGTVEVGTLLTADEGTRGRSVKANPRAFGFVLACLDSEGEVSFFCPYTVRKSSWAALACAIFFTGDEQSRLISSWQAARRRKAGRRRAAS